MAGLVGGHPRHDPCRLDLEHVRSSVAEHHGREGPLLPILHDVQAEFGCVDEDAEVLIAKGLNLSRADVHGVVSFYHDFSDKADGRPVVVPASPVV